MLSSSSQLILLLKIMLITNLFSQYQLSMYLNFKFNSQNMTFITFKIYFNDFQIFRQFITPLGKRNTRFRKISDLNFQDVQKTYRSLRKQKMTIVVIKCKTRFTRRLLEIHIKKFLRIEIDNSCYKNKKRFTRRLLDIHIVQKKCTKVYWEQKLTVVVIKHNRDS